MNANSTLALKVEGAGQVVAHVGLHTLAGLWEAMAETRAQLWRRAGTTTGTDTVGRETGIRHSFNLRGVPRRAQ